MKAGDLYGVFKGLSGKAITIIIAYKRLIDVSDEIMKHLRTGDAVPIELVQEYSNKRREIDNIIGDIMV